MKAGRLCRSLPTAVLVLMTCAAAESAEKEWTLLFYMIGDSGNEGGAIDDINAMERGIDTTNCNVIVQLDRIPDNDSSNGDWTECRRFFIEPDPNADRVIRSTELQNLGEVNMGDPQTLADLIIYGIQNYPAKRYGVIVWGGANPGGIGADMSDTDPYFGSSFDPIRTIVGDLTQALELATSAAGRRLDFLVCWGCNYGSFENDYVIREYADVTARSQIPTNYMLGAATDILSWLGLNPAATARELAVAWVDAYADYCLSTSGLMAGWCSVDLGPGYVDLGAALDTFARELIKAGGRDQADIAAAMAGAAVCDSKGSPEASFDMNHFAKLVTSTAALPQALKDAAQAVVDGYGYPPPQTGRPLVNFRFEDGGITGNENWPTTNKSEFRGTKIRYEAYPTEIGGVPVPETCYLPFVTNNAWHWFLDGETSLPAEPLLTYESNSLGDAVPASGSTESFALTLQNGGGATATGVSGVLSLVVADPYVTIVQDTSAFPDIVSEGAGAAQADFGVTVDAGAPVGRRVWFWLDLTADGGFYTNRTSFCLEVVPPSPNSPPEAVVDVASLNVATDEDPGFDGSGSSDPDGGIASYEWDFDYDGLTFDVQATGATPSWTCSTPGTYAVALRVTDDDGATDVSTATVTVHDATDSDLDGLPDSWELDYFSEVADCVPEEDSDGDGLANATEYTRGTDPLDADTDDDGYSDGEEMSAGTDPLDAASHPDAGGPLHGDGGGCGGGAAAGGLAFIAASLAARGRKR